MRRTRTGFTLVEMLVVIAVVSILLALLLPAVQKVRQSANRISCQNNLKQLGIALHHYHLNQGAFPPGMISSSPDISDADATGFTLLLPYLEQDNTYLLYDFKQSWFQPANYAAVETPIKTFLCPANRAEGYIDLTAVAAEWNTPLPQQVAACDYAFCKGANGSMNHNANRLPLSVRGVFQIRSVGGPRSGVRLDDIRDGTSMTIAMGEAAGGTVAYLTRDINNPSQAAVDPFTGQTVMIDQSWGAAGAGDTAHPWYGSVFATTAQYGLAPDPRDEPMNQPLVAPTVNGGDPSGSNQTGKDWVSGFRSMHPLGCNFLFCDGSVHFLLTGIDPGVYRALSTYAGGENVSSNDF
jgi:prepilin-type N-terminal cleavage/methylation domain-containing protein/prepilin-type processing-associated H-X9-DG protein